MNTSTTRTALVTGGSRGIGRAISERLAGDGTLVAVHYGTNRQAADETVAGITAKGGSAFAIGARLDHPDEITDLFDRLDSELTERTGSTRLDVLVNNAGIAGMLPFAATTPDAFDELFAINTRAPFFTTQHAATRMNTGGRVVTISTGLTRKAEPNLIAYSMSKAAIDVMTLALAKELGANGITVNAVAPGVIDTDMNAGWLRSDPAAAAGVAALSPFGRIGQPGDVADVVAFLASDDARWVTGQWLDASGGALL